MERSLAFIDQLCYVNIASSDLDTSDHDSGLEIQVILKDKS